MSQGPIIVSLCSSLLLALPGVSLAKKTTGEDDSVYQWGRWSVLTPAAGGEEVAGAEQVVRANELGAGEAAELTGEVEEIEANGDPEEPVEPEPPQSTGPCNVGPCGFTRIENTDNGNGTEQTALFGLELDEGAGTASYTVAPGTVGEIASAEIPINTGPARFQDASPIFVSLFGNTERDDTGTAAAVVGFWKRTPDGPRNFYVWGIPATAADIDSLVADSLGGSQTVNYSGPQAHGGVAALTLDFGNNSWTGSFTGSALPFEVQDGGIIDGAAIRTDASTSYTNNIDAAASFVEGGVVNHGDNVIGRYEVRQSGLEGGAHSDVFFTERQAGETPVPTLE